MYVASRCGSVRVLEGGGYLQNTSPTVPVACVVEHGRFPGCGHVGMLSPRYESALAPLRVAILGYRRRIEGFGLQLRVSLVGAGLVDEPLAAFGRGLGAFAISRLRDRDHLPHLPIMPISLIRPASAWCKRMLTRTSSLKGESACLCGATDSP